MLYLDEENDPLWAVEAMGLHPYPFVEKASLASITPRTKREANIQGTLSYSIW